MRYLSLPRVLNSGRFSGEWDVSWHSHAGDELVLVTSGACDHRVNGKDMRGERGTLFICPAEVPQYQVTHGFAETTYVVFHWNAAYFSGAERAVSLNLEGPERRWLEDICDLWMGNAPGSENLMGALMLAVLESISMREARHEKGLGLHPALREAQMLIEARVGGPLDVAALAKACHVSAGYLNELFQAAHECGPLEYHQRLRLARAARLLESPYLSVAQVAAQCGYEDANFFARQFRRQFGYAPSKHRGG